MLLGVTKEFVGELKRYKEDKKVNATPVTRLMKHGSPAKGGDPLSWEQTCLADVRVGDIIRIDDREQVPADCVLLKVADNKPEAFVKTAALDGERNLKPKLADAELSAHIDRLFSAGADDSKACITVSCIEPVKELYYFEGRIRG